MADQCEEHEQPCSVRGKPREKRGAQDMQHEEDRAAKKTMNISSSGQTEEETNQTVCREEEVDEATGAPGAKDDHDIGSGSVVPETASSMPPAEDVQTVFKRMAEETKEFYAKWIDPFSESDEFERFCPARLDELLKEAYSLEKNLKQQKERMKEKLIHLSQTLGGHTTQ